MPDPQTERLDASLSAELRIDAVCRRFETAWKAGEQPTIESYLSGWDAADRELLLRELKLIDDEYRRRATETPSLINLSHHSTFHSKNSTQEDELLPRPFGRYTLRQLLGRGGMGRVYLAHDPQLDRLVALKMPNPVTGNPGWRDRFITEARAAATLAHPNVCPVHDVGEVDGQPYLTMAYIEGETLAARLTREGVLPPEAAVELVVTVARAMHEAHRRGIVHRDLKPSNLMLDPAGRPVIMDFGLALRSNENDDLRLTLTGVAMGTPAYMPPEQAGGDHTAIGPPSDVYSLGIVLYEVLTGKTPFSAPSFGKLLAKIERDPPPLPSSLNPEIDATLEAIILTALAKSPAARFADAGKLADALEQYQRGEHAQLLLSFSKPYVIPDAVGDVRAQSTTVTTILPPHRRRRAWLLTGVAALFLAVVAGAVIYVQTDYGQLVVQLSDPNAQVEVRVNGQEVTLDPGGGKAIRVRANADHKLDVTGPDYETVADSYLVKRGDVTLARVTLKPRAKGAKKEAELEPESNPKRPEVATGDSSRKPNPGPAKPRPVSFPASSLCVRLSGWEILTNANKDEMRKWLDERKKNHHSVIWLDAILVAKQPLYAAVAALDDRTPDWQTFLDLECPPGKNVLENFGKNLDTKTNCVVSVSSYEIDNNLFAVALWQPGRKEYIFGNHIDPFHFETLIEPRCLSENPLWLRV